MEEDAKRDDAPLLRLAAVLALTFAVVLCGSAAYLKSSRHASARPAVDARLARMTRPQRLDAAIRSHPDPQIATDLLGADGKEGVRLEIKEMAYEDGLFSIADGHPTIAIKTSVFDKAVSAQGIQYLWGILSHEHEHYLQWREGESSAYMQAAIPLSETDCTLSLTLEIGAYAKACRDARKYGWDNVLYQCDAVSLPSVAEEKIEHDLPRTAECDEVWRFFGGEKTRKAVQVKVRSDPTAAPTPPPLPRGPTYLAPP